MYKNVLVYAGINIKLFKSVKILFKKVLPNVFTFSLNLKLKNEGEIFTILCYC